MFITILMQILDAKHRLCHLPYSDFIPLSILGTKQKLFQLRLFLEYTNVCQLCYLLQRYLVSSCYKWKNQINNPRVFAPSPIDNMKPSQTRQEYLTSFSRGNCSLRTKSKCASTMTESFQCTVYQNEGQYWRKCSILLLCIVCWSLPPNSCSESFFIHIIYIFLYISDLLIHYPAGGRETRSWVD